MWTAWDISLNRAKQPQFYFDIWYSGNAGPAFQPATRVELFKLDRAIAMLKERKDAVYLGERKMYGPRNYAKSYDFNSWKLGDCAVCLETLKSNIGSCERMLMPENLIKIFGKDPVNILEMGTILGLNPEERKLELCPKKEAELITMPIFERAAESIHSESELIEMLTKILNN